MNNNEELSTKERIMNAAKDLMSTHGFKGTTTKMIADAANVNEVTLFRHFKNKMGILVELLKFIKDEDIPLKKFIDTDFESVEEVLNEFSSTFLAEAAKQKEVLIFGMKEMGCEEEELSKFFIKVILKTSNILADKLEDLYTKGKIRRTDFQVAAHMYIHSLLGSFMMHHTLGGEAFSLEIERVCSSSTEILLKSLERGIEL